MKKHPYLLVFFFILIIFFVINKLSKNFLETSKYEKISRINYIEKVYGKKNLEDYLRVHEEQNHPLKYVPFVEFVETARTGKFIIVNKSGNRCNSNIPDECTEPFGGKEEIWMFGGSTTFGYGVKNNETIASYTEELFEGKKRVVNFGAGFHYSTQERIFFQNLLTHFDAPYAAIFIDGVNDFGLFWPQNQTAYSQRIKESLQNKKQKNNRFVKWIKERVTRLNIYRLVDEKIFKEKYLNNKNKKKVYATNKQLNLSIKTLKENHKMNLAMGKLYDVNIINVLQPAPIHENSYKLSNIPKDFLPEKDDESLQNVISAYTLIKKTDILSKSKFFLNLEGFKINNGMYVDGFHYSPLFNKAIANQIYNYLVVNLE